MPVLLFRDRGWEVAASSWVAAAKPDRKVELCYQWGADGISWFDSGTGNARCTLDILMDDFTKRIARHTNGGIVDFRDVSR
jgi:hypothetical protein